jgi:flagellin-specific chaperone FliS
MTQGQRESIFLIYVNVCNALIYAEDLLVEESVSKAVKDGIRPIKDKLAWIKRNMDLKVHSDVSKTVDTLRYDWVVRLLSNMPEEYQQQFEDTVVKFLNSIEK